MIWRIYGAVVLTIYNYVVPPASPRRPLFAFCAQHAMRRYNEQTSNGEFDVELRADGSDTLLELKEKIAVRSVAPLPPHRRVQSRLMADASRLSGRGSQLRYNRH